MTTAIAVPGLCKKCGTTNLILPADHTANSWLDCEQCGEPTVTWGAYKNEALNMAAAAIKSRRGGNGNR
jgi:hypothetical protein